MIPNLTNIDELKEVLSRHSIAPSKAMGQNFLISPEVVEATLDALEGGPNVITELGPGVGTLTQALIASGYRVRGIEKDNDFVQLLPKVLPPKLRKNLDIIHADLKDADWGWDKDYQLVGNIPYNLSGFIIRKLTQLEPAPAQTILLVQKEVGQRMSSAPPDMNLLALAIQLWGNAQRLLNIPPNCFWPQPSIHSQLILLTPYSSTTSIATRERVLSVAKIFFQQKRKQMGGTLQRSFSKSAQEAERILQTANIPTTTRPQELTTEQWIMFANELPLY